MAEVYPILWRQQREEKILRCLNQKCNDVCMYTYAASMKVEHIHCEQCGRLTLTDKMPKNKMPY